MRGNFLLCRGIQVVLEGGMTRLLASFSARRKATLTAAGETEKNLYFVTESVQRAFYPARMVGKK
jgi:hypothetical protein